MSTENGLLLLNKQKGITSHSSLTPVKQVFLGKKVGHTGTLDRFAEGLMLVLIGPSLALAASLQGMDKEYIATVHFGFETDTLDPEGRIITRRKPPELETIKEICPQFIGKIIQQPPDFAAIRLNGERAWKRKRRGENFSLPEREVEVYDIAILDYTDNMLRCRCHVSKGTYIRALWRDIARACNSCAHLTALYRTKVGTFHHHNAITDVLSVHADNIIPPENFVKDIPGVNICYTDRDGELQIERGKELYKKHLLNFSADQLNICYNSKGKALACVKMNTKALRYRRL